LCSWVFWITVITHNVQTTRPYSKYNENIIFRFCILYVNWILYISVLLSLQPELTVCCQHAH
jgi:hypothetical protein